MEIVSRFQRAGKLEDCKGGTYDNATKGDVE
jgi:hypothetical protein